MKNTVYCDKILGSGYMDTVIEPTMKIKTTKKNIYL